MKHKQIPRSGVPNSVWPAGPTLGRSIENKLIGVTLAVVLTLALVNLIGTNALATQGIVLDQILKETDKIGKNNQTIMVEIGKKANLTNIQTTAVGLGFVRVKNNLIISADEALAAITQR